MDDKTQPEKVNDNSCFWDWRKTRAQEKQEESRLENQL